MELKRSKDNFWRTVYVTKLLKSFDGKYVTGIVYKVSETADSTHLLGIEISVIKMDNVEYNIVNEWDNIKFEEHFKTLCLLDQI
jgi:hypothetical protein